MPTLARFDPRSLCAPIDALRPSGESLEYDPMFVAMERAASGREEQQFGRTIIEEQPPQWDAVRGIAIDLVQRTHDLRVGVHLAESVIESEGLAGFTQCLQMLTAWLRNEWETVHPQLEADDDHDPTLRVNTLTRLTDARRVVRRLRAVPLSEVRGMGTITIGALTDLAETTAPDSDSVRVLEAALSAGPVEPLLEAVASLRGALDAVRALDEAISERVGVARSVEFEPLHKLLKAAMNLLSDRLYRRGVRVETANAPAPSSETAADESTVSMNAGSTNPADSTMNDANEAPMSPRTSSHTAPLDWTVESRSDVTAALDRVCDYFARHEPSSPVPLLLGRAKRLVSMSFLEILQELGPEFLAQAQRPRENGAPSR